MRYFLALLTSLSFASVSCAQKMTPKDVPNPRVVLIMKFCLIDNPQVCYDDQVTDDYTSSLAGDPIIDPSSPLAADYPELAGKTVPMNIYICQVHGMMPAKRFFADKHIEKKYFFGGWKCMFGTEYRVPDMRI